MATKIHNAKLKTSMEALVKKSFGIYNPHIITTSHYTELQIAQLLRQQEDNIRKEVEYKKAFQELNADSIIQPLFGKLVGTYSNLISTSDADRCIFSFVERLYLKNNTYAEDLFDSHYASFEELFYSDHLRFIDKSRLHYFESDIDEIVLEDGLAIKKSPELMNQQKLMFQMQYQPGKVHSKSEFIIERIYTRKKIVQEGNREELQMAD